MNVVYFLQGKCILVLLEKILAGTAKVRFPDENSRFQLPTDIVMLASDR